MQGERGKAQQTCRFHNSRSTGFPRCYVSVKIQTANIILSLNQVKNRYISLLFKVFSGLEPRIRRQQIARIVCFLNGITIDIRIHLKKYSQSELTIRLMRLASVECHNYTAIDSKSHSMLISKCVKALSSLLMSPA